MLLELRALREGCWKLSEYTTYANRLVLSVSRGLKALLGLSKRAHPDIQAMAIDLAQYKPKFLVNTPSVAPSAMGMEDQSEPMEPAAYQEFCSDMVSTEKALNTPNYTPPKSRF